MNDSYWKNKTVVVSGGSGFIGSHFVEELAALGANVISLTKSNPVKELAPRNNVRYVNIDLLDYRSFDNLCESTTSEINCFIHCAALDGNSEYKLKYAAKILDDNNRLVSNVLNGCRKNGINDVVIMSSSEIYTDTTPKAIAETNDYHEGISFSSNGYFLSKVFAEILSELYANQYGMHIYLPRPANVYGERDGLKPGINRVIPSMIDKVARGEDIEIWGDGTQSRSFIYVKDLVHTTLAMIKGKYTGPLNVSTKDQVSILDLAKIISDRYGSKVNINLDKTKPTGAAARMLDISKMHEIIDFEPVPIQDGIENTIQWYKNTIEPR